MFVVVLLVYNDRGVSICGDYSSVLLVIFNEKFSKFLISGYKNAKRFS